ncbi:24817_t:CDS:2 [Racocetra persica]|uniref:24817_t:CDS:1 n=1 Tax=Racocetra persica TaxID=160502 RepID=A0ACA9QX12_9GLOM|nr:24817_t:CDS:2 [Racocetra persica]
MSQSDSEVIKEKKKKHVDLTWFRENENINFRRPIMFPNNEGHITEYIQIKLNNKQNTLLDKEHREFLKQYKFVLDKDNNIIDEASKEYLLELLYPEVKIVNIKFKNDYSFDLRELLAQDNDIIVSIELSKLYTWDFKTGQYKMILNKNRQVTKNYRGGIYVRYGDTYENMHKPKVASVKNPKRRGKECSKR